MAVFYISPAGNDTTGTGAIGNPWKTLFKATSTVTTGNTIHVNAGTYLETSQCALPVGVSLEGDGITSIIQSTLTAQFVPILTIQSTEGTNGNQHVRNLKFDGRNLATSWGIAVGGRSNVEIDNCTIVDFMEVGVNWNGRNDSNNIAPSIYATGNSFHDNIVTNCATADFLFGRGCFQFGGQDGMLIYNNTIVNKTRATAAGGWPIKNCNDGFHKNCKIYNNYLERGPYPYTYNGANNYWNFAIEMFNEQGLEIYGNTILGSIDANFQSKGSSSYGVYIHDNIIGQASLSSGYESGIILEFGTETAIIENNTIKNVANAVYFTPRTGNSITNVTIQKNLLYNVGISGGGAGFGIAQQTPEDGTITTTNFLIYNNTIIGATGGNASNYGIRIPDGGPSTNIKIINNIIENFLVRNIVANPAGGINGLEIKNNRYYQNGNADVVGFNGTPVNYTNSGNTIGDPNLDVSYHPNIGSACINAGIDVGLPFLGGNPDIGFYETGGADLTAPTIVSITPANNANNVILAIAPHILFSEALDASTVNGTNVTLIRGGSTVSVGLSYSSNIITITPSIDLIVGSIYTISIGTGIKDIAGNNMASASNTSFITTTNSPGAKVKRRTRVL